MENSKQINWKEVEVDASQLRNYSQNPRNISENSLKLLKESVETYGQAVPLVVNQDMTVLGGNQRLKVMDGKVKVLIPDRMLSEHEEKELVIILNNKLGEWDYNKVMALGFSHETLVNSFGFDEEYLANQEINLSDFDIDLDDFSNELESQEDKLIKQFVVKFENITPEEISKEIEESMGRNNVQSLEDLILKQALKYENYTN